MDSSNHTQNISLYLLPLICMVTACRSGQQTEHNGCRMLVSLCTNGQVNNIRAETICHGDTVVSTWPLPYPVYRFDCADVDGDGVADIAVGVEKKTRFDNTLRKRLFLFKSIGGYIRPMWLGSRMSQPLADFVLVKDSVPVLIRTVEEERDKSFLVAEYKWGSFGLHFIRYIKRNISRKDADAIIGIPEMVTLK